METIKRTIRYGIFPLYIFLTVLGVYYWQIPLSFGQGMQAEIMIPTGLILNFLLLYLGMWAFVRRKLKLVNYILSALFMLFYYVLFWTELFSVVATVLFLPDKWVFYGLLYTLLIIVFGIQFIVKKRNDRYQVVRTISVIAVQLILAFILPLLFRIIINKEYYLSYFWPLKIEYFYPAVIFEYPLPFILYSFIFSLIVFPVLALTLGKRFYCSWICGCGGLAETFGDRWRHLSDKSSSAWKFQTMKKLIRQVLSSPANLFKKFEAILHLSYYFVHPLLLFNILLLIPLILSEEISNLFHTLLGSGATILSFSFFIPILFFVCALFNAHKDWKQRVSWIPYTILFGTGLAVNNSIAVFQAISGTPSEFVRTPKVGIYSKIKQEKQKKYSIKRKIPISETLELFFFLYSAVGIGCSIASGKFFIIPFLLIYSLAFGTVFFLGLVQKIKTG